ncbi:hypothetical protein ACIQXV_29195 [Neobacillus sp. NPDC097160]|uniref:hypothetical protein n=1 Tax=Neobacillus sp. NPDC097160 TaxID=3364298 RepID=UPI00381A0025
MPFLDLTEEIDFFETTLEEEGFSLLKENFSRSTLILKEEDALNSKEDDADSFKHKI